MLPASPNPNYMSKQYNKEIKKKRRVAYLKRKKARVQSTAKKK